MGWLNSVKKSTAPTVTDDLLAFAMPACPDADAWALALTDALPVAGIDTGDGIAHFLAQLGHESSDLTRLSESLWYTPNRLCAVWPGRFPSKKAAMPYARNPQRLANNVYAGRLGNVRPGDGWRFRGRGPIQLTGRDNYARCAEATGLPLIDHPDRLAERPEYGATAAAWYWSQHVTRSSVRGITRQINGGLNGLGDRAQRYNRITEYMGNGGD